MTTPDPRIASLRAAVAKLGEALAYTGTSPNGAAAIISEAEALAGGHLTPQGEGIGFFGNWRDHYNSHYGGWRWITQAAQLRLLAEAEILEQERDEIYPRYSWLGALVREWRGGVK